MNKFRFLISVLIIFIISICFSSCENNIKSNLTSVSDIVSSTNIDNTNSATEPLSIQDYTYEVTEDGITIVSYNGKDKNVIIPERIEGQTVTIINGSAFSNCHEVISITIPSSIIYIEEMAFGSFFYDNVQYNKNDIDFETTKSLHKYNKIESINVDENNLSYKSMDGILFNKDGRELICFPEGKNIKDYTVPEDVVIIGKSAFNCSLIENVILPENLITIESEAFANSRVLKNINIPGTVEEIGSFAFSGCFNLQSVIISDGIMEGIREGAFEYCISLKSIILPENLGHIGGDVFYMCTSLTSIHIPDNVIYLSDASCGDGNIFRYCYSLTNITVGNNNRYFKSIDGVLFRKDRKELFCFPAGLKKETYIMPENIESTDYFAFSGCTDLKSITFPKSLKFLCISNIFEGCSNLIEVKFEGDAPKDPLSEDWGDGPENPDIKFYFHSDAKYFSSPLWYGYPTEIW